MFDHTGQSIGRYHVLEKLGSGGMAIVYKAYDTHLERNVAIKLIRTDQFGSAVIERILKRFEREAKVLAKLTHPNIVGIIDYGDYQEIPYLVMEFLAGGTFKQFLGTPMPFEKAAGLLAPVADALGYAHQKGIVHRDIKPGNILITEGGLPMLTDFGIAHLMENEEGSTLTGTGVGVGTPEYMSPEQSMGHKVDGRTDIYSLGVVLYELVTGHKPYTADTPMAVVLKQNTEPLPRPSVFVPCIPEKVEQILFKSLSKNAEDRYQRMEDMLKAFRSTGIEEKQIINSFPAETDDNSEDTLATSENFEKSAETMATVEEKEESFESLTTTDDPYATTDQVVEDPGTSLDPEIPVISGDENPASNSIVNELPMSAEAKKNTQTGNTDMFVLFVVLGICLLILVIFIVFFYNWYTH